MNKSYEIPRMINFLESLEEQLDEVAAVWLEEGASTFSVWSQEKMLHQWRNGASDSDTAIVAPILLKDSPVGEIRVTGVSRQGAEKRLHTDAQLISSLLPLAQEKELLAEQLVDARDQLISFYSITDATRKSMDIISFLKVMTTEAAKILKAQEVLFFIQFEDHTPITVFFPEPTVNTAHLVSQIQSLPSKVNPYLFSIDPKNDTLYEQKSFMLIPFKVYNARTAIIGFHKGNGNEFNSADIKLGKSIADHAGAQLENISILRSNPDKVRLETEIEFAQRIQESMLPQSAPEVTGLDIQIAYQPASRIGGDFYDFIFQSEDKLTAVIGDISGKGMPAALLMAMNLKVVRSEASRSSLPLPNKIISRSSNLLYRDFNQAVMFSTIFIGQYDRATREFNFANAGHSPVIYCPKGQNAVMLKADSVPLGLFLDINPKIEKIWIRPGDVLVMATDGINETSNLSNRLFGITQLMGLVEKLSAYDAVEIKEGIMDAVHIYGAGKVQEDDRTVIVLKGK